MSIDPAAVQKIAWLARLKLAENDVAEYARQLSGILELVDQMNRIDTTGIEALAHPLELSLRTREDVVTETDRREAFQIGAPEVAAGLYLVPKVIG
ncbi:MAG: Asp-tRNA(Asn)/Glu-tRNA(Gln) amidotransferase subunit GatC [Beggiatoa sp.]|nr:Asp-tRNA(Asn)/Glu-tRNA(Gln) amidotransferase subunit GatC [Beggiatoa sp.]